MEENKELEQFIQSLERNELSEEQQVLLSGIGGSSGTTGGAKNSVISNCDNNDNCGCSNQGNCVKGCACPS